MPETQALTAPGSVRWTALDSWQTATEVPVVYRGGTAVRSVALTGPDASDFTLAPQGCQGRSGPCEVRVGFRPQAAGVRSAAVRFTASDGRVHEAALEGFAHGGTTQADIKVLPGDLAGVPGTYTYRPSAARFAGRTYDTETVLFLIDDDRNYFDGRFGAGGATPLTVGDYPDAGTGFGPGPWLDVFGTPTGCSRSGGAFTVHEIRRLPDGGLRSFDVSFSHECYADHRPALEGRWRYRAGATAALAPWLSSGPRPAIAAPPLASDPTAPLPSSTAGATGSGPGAPAAAQAATAAEFRRVRIAARWLVRPRSRARGDSSCVRSQPEPVCGCAAAGAAAHSGAGPCRRGRGRPTPAASWPVPGSVPAPCSSCASPRPMRPRRSCATRSGAASDREQRACVSPRAPARPAAARPDRRHRSGQTLSPCRER